MSLFRRIELGFIALLLVAVASLSGYAVFQNHQLGKAKEETSLQTARADANGVAAREYIRLTQKKDTANAQLDAALEANPEYAGAPVPDAAAALLRHPSGAARAVPE